MRQYTDRQQRAAQATRQRNRSEHELGQRDDMRETGSMLLIVNGFVFDLRLEPDRRDVRRWKIYRDGAPWMHCGLEQMWRAMQAEMVLPIGRRHWAPGGYTARDEVDAQAC